MTITIYHNSACDTSRNTLAMIRAGGDEPAVIEYLTSPPTRETLVRLLKDMRIAPRELLRPKATFTKEDGEIVKGKCGSPPLSVHPRRE